MTARRASLFLAYASVAAAVVGLSALHAQRYDYALTGTSRWVWALVYTFLLIIAAYSVGLPDVPRGWSRLTVAISAAGGAAVAISVFQIVLGSQLLPRFVVFGSAIALTAWWTLVAHLYDRARPLAEQRTPVVFVGGDVEEETLQEDVARAPERPAYVAAVVDVAQARPRRRADEPLVDLVIASNATLLVLSRAAQADPFIVSQAATLHESGIRVRTLTAFYEEWLGKLPASELERISLLFDIRELHTVTYARLKRLGDIVAGVFGLLAFAIALPFVVVGNVVANRGPLFYRQARIGRSGTRFQILKFRTMVPNGDEAEGGDWTTEDDPRVTRFGRILRRTHLDELPQFLNIVRGDLSLVGPRPEQPQYVEKLVEKLPFYDLRHLVRPGLTGWAQVKFGYAASEDDALEKLQYDFFYLGHQRFRLDGRIVLRTLRATLTRGGR